ncbi:MAG: hypothetical protein K2P87_04340 [Lachnospiraceae bacterium]|nr:hypothetical protein [Lachnospiraceae bacterium]
MIDLVLLEDLCCRKGTVTQILNVYGDQSTTSVEVGLTTWPAKLSLIYASSKHIATSLASKIDTIKGVIDAAVTYHEERMESAILSTKSVGVIAPAKTVPTQKATRRAFAES